MFVNPICTEELLQYIWQSGLYNPFHLTTVDGEPLTVLHPGTLNRDGGPDFTAARVCIGGVEWAGNVEIHYRTSDWRRHGHHRNKRYDNVVLHVVFVHDASFTGAPCLELQSRVSKLLLRRYQSMLEGEAFIPCAPLLSRLEDRHWTPWMQRLLQERLERKAGVLGGWLAETRSNWEETCFRAIAQGLGMPVNAAAFQELARSLPFMVMARQRSEPERLEALLFGQAGMLEGRFADEYPRRLQDTYYFLRHKHRLSAMPGHRWQWLRMRPSAFPTMRIAWLAALLYRHPRLFSRLLDASGAEELESLFFVEPSPYWEHHYRFDVPSVRTAGIGKATVRHLLINAVAPLLALYAKEMGLSTYRERAFRLLGALAPEQNRIIRAWSDAGVQAAHAGDTQALLELKQYYCDAKRCLECQLGTEMIGGGVMECREWEAE
ncbi:DUF2851 family protein [Chitinophaga lutea]